MQLLSLKQEIEQNRQHEEQLRRDFDRVLFDAETDRKYFVTELAKREILLDSFKGPTEKVFLDRKNKFSFQKKSGRAEITYPLDPRRWFVFR